MASSSFTIPTSRHRPSKSPESFDSLRRRNLAAEILQSYEKLSWMSFKRCESIAQTRMYFKAVVAGMPPDDDGQGVKWKEDFTPHPPKPGEEPKRSSKKGKERASMGRAFDGAGRDDGSDRKRKGKQRKSAGESAETSDAVN